MRSRRLALLLCFAVLVGPDVVRAADYRETKVATQFQVFAPPNNDSNRRYSALIITAVSGTSSDPCIVDVFDDGADGDTDDEILGVSLIKGQSVVRYIKDGAINDDYQGTWDGDYFRVASTQPVVVHLATDSYWQHDWVPSDNGTLRGTTFYMYSSYGSRDVNVFAYEDNTRVMLFDVTDAPTSGSGVTSVDESAAVLVLSADLDTGQDLFHTMGQGAGVMQVGRTYKLTATRPVTAVSGAITSRGIRDGGGFVPGARGATVGNAFYFGIPHEAAYPQEQELRVVSTADGVTAVLEGWNATTEVYDTLETWPMSRFDHRDYVGGTYDLYRLTSTGGDVALFEANWLETGAVGTSDVASFVSGVYAGDGTGEFLVYLGPPGIESNTTQQGTFTHVYLYSAKEARDVLVYDADTQGTLFSRQVTIPAGGVVDIAIDAALYAQLNRPSDDVRPYLKVQSPRPIAVMMSNWNDNWMAYATAVVVRNPEVEIQAPETLEVGSTTTLTGTVRNDGEVLMDMPELSGTIPPNFELISATWNGVALPTGALTAGGVEFSSGSRMASMAPGESWPFELQVRSISGVSGDVPSFHVMARATEGGDRLASAASATTTLTSSGVVSLGGLRAEAGSGQNMIRWEATSTSPAASSMEVQVGASPSGPWATIPGSAQAYQSDGAYSYLHDGLAGGTTYHYRVVATGTNGATSSVGPVSATPSEPPPLPPGLQLTREIDGVELWIEPSASASAVGYHIERKASWQTAWSKITASAVASGVFEDSSARYAGSYDYRAYAVSSSGLKSERSPIVTATPVRGAVVGDTHVLAFEDMLGPDQNDWDYNDFIVRVDVVVDTSVAERVGVTFDYEPLARGAGYIHKMRQRVPAQSDWTATLTVYDAEDTSRAVKTRTFSGTGDVDVLVFSKTRDALEPLFGSYTNTSVEQDAFEPGQTARLEIEFDTSMGAGPTGDAPWDLYLRLPYLSGDREIHRPAYAGAQELTNRLSALGGVPLDFVTRLSATNPTWPVEGQPIWVSFPDFVVHALQGIRPTWYDAPTSLDDVFHPQRGAR